ncbi:hypothetical protein ACLB2K_064956 [Fragaria x ananassa]
MQSAKGVNAAKHFTNMFAGLMEDGYFKAAMEIKKMTLDKGVDTRCGYPDRPDGGLCLCWNDKGCSQCIQ